MRKCLFTLIIMILMCSVAFAQHKDFSTMSFEEQGEFLEGVWEYISPDGNTIFTAELFTTKQLDENGSVDRFFIIGCYKLIKNGSVIEDNLYKLDKYKEGSRILQEDDNDYTVLIGILNNEYICHKKYLNRFYLFDQTSGLCADPSFYDFEYSYIKLISSKKGEETIFMHLSVGEWYEDEEDMLKEFSMPVDMALKKKC